MLNLGKGSKLLQISFEVTCVENQHFFALDFFAHFVLNRSAGKIWTQFTEPFQWFCQNGSYLDAV